MYSVPRESELQKIKPWLHTRAHTHSTDLGLLYKTNTERAKKILHGKAGISEKKLTDLYLSEGCFLNIQIL